ncbi:hypothetical protein C8F04DRAFT_1058397 [Mycena alexandri]|uniref:Uncharacterized protein n=1 Tax=Mycena alexandri TaxID=1745969 RepID=A0AAD6TL36_9AGAR|nr:hypothetical protein C8F04DRAFT_1058397 [Mycena alexandri]
MDIATAKFQEALPYALLSVSPSLSALHSVRIGSSNPSSCQRCGCALHRGESSVRTVRRPNISKARAIQTTCMRCGFQWESPLARGNAVLFPRTKKTRTINPEATVVYLPEERAAVSKVQEPSRQSIAVEKRPITQQAAPSPVPSAKPGIGIATKLSGAPRSTPKSRPKKKGGLQSMLERNKERESKEKQNGSGGGLAMFLNNL